MVQLKTQWAATKIVARKEVAEHRKEVYKTGGGSQPPDIPVTSNDISVWLPIRIRSGFKRIRFRFCCEGIEC